MKVLGPILLLCCLLFISVGVSSCQTKKLATVTTEIQSDQDYILRGQYKILEYDKLGNTYLVSANNEILQLKDGEVRFRYSSKRLGDIRKIDVSNPQKILVYFNDYYQIVFLDNTLSEINKLDLEELGYWDIQGVALSRDNQIWIYDPTNVRLLKIDEQGKIQQSSNELYDYGFTNSFTPDIMVMDNKVYVYDEDKLKVFDEFGVWHKNIPLANEGIQAGEGYFFFQQQQKLLSYATNVEFKNPIEPMFALRAPINDFVLLKDKVLLIDDLGFYSSSYK